MGLMFAKPSRTARKVQEWKAKRARESDERKEKAKVRARDRRCRFPGCGCGKLKLRLEVSHDTHKGMGSKDGVSTADQMVLLCVHRHQHGAVSRHAGTLRARFLTSEGYNGAVAWDVDLGALLGRDTGRLVGWVEVAREKVPGVYWPGTARQEGLLRLLAEMER